MGIVVRAAWSLYSMLSLVLIALLTASVHSQTLDFGSCPQNVNVKENFDISRYMGTWYEISKIPNYFQSGSMCARAVYTLQDDGSVHVDNSGMRQGEVSRAVGEAIVREQSEPAKLAVRFSEYAPYGPYWVVDTDYESYAFIWSCTDYLFGLGHTEFAWLLGREKHLEHEVVSRILENARSMGVSVQELIDTDQSCTQNGAFPQA